MTQMERNDVITTFKKKEIPILVATDVAGTVHRVNFAPFFFFFGPSTLANFFGSILNSHSHSCMIDTL